MAGTQFSWRKGYVLSGDGDDHNPLSAGEFGDTIHQMIYDQLTSSRWCYWAPVCIRLWDMHCMKITIIITNLPIAMYKYKLDNMWCIDSLALNYSSIATYDMVVVVILQDVRILRLLIITLMHVLMMVVVSKQFWPYESNCIKL